MHGEINNLGIKAVRPRVHENVLHVSHLRKSEVTRD